jgi:hypothetical protein
VKPTRSDLYNDEDWDLADPEPQIVVGLTSDLAPPAGHNSGDLAEEDAVRDELKKLEGFSLQQLLQAGQEALVRRLVALVNAGIASHQEQAILRNILKDNGMVMGLASTETPGASSAPLDLPDLPDEH